MDTLTLSHAQKAAADESIQALGLQNLITVHVMDYRCMPQEWKGQFDVVVSIGVMEHGVLRSYSVLFLLVAYVVLTPWKTSWC